MKRFLIFYDNAEIDTPPFRNNMGNKLAVEILRILLSFTKFGSYYTLSTFYTPALDMRSRSGGGDDLSTEVHLFLLRKGASSEVCLSLLPSFLDSFRCRREFDTDNDLFRTDCRGGVIKL